MLLPGGEHGNQSSPRSPPRNIAPLRPPAAIPPTANGALSDSDGHKPPAAIPSGKWRFVRRRRTQAPGRYPSNRRWRLVRRQRSRRALLREPGASPSLELCSTFPASAPPANKPTWCARAARTSARAATICNHVVTAETSADQAGSPVADALSRGCLRQRS